MKPIRDELPNRASPQTHLDDVRLVVRLTGAPSGGVRQTTSGLLCLWSGPLSVSLEEAARYSSAVAWNEEREIFEPFVSNQRYTQVEWGASGSTLEFAVEVLNGMAVESVMLGMGYAIAKIRGRGGRSSSALLRAAEGMSHDFVKATAAIFEIDPDDLEVISLRVDRKKATILMKSEGRRFRATVKRLDSGDSAVFVERED